MKKEQLKRVQADWEQYTKEHVEVEYIKGTIYGYCSERAALRLFKKYEGTKGLSVQYSTNMGTWFFSLNTEAR